MAKLTYEDGLETAKECLDSDGIDIPLCIASWFDLQADHLIGEFASGFIDGLEEFLNDKARKDLEDFNNLM